MAGTFLDVRYRDTLPTWSVGTGLTGDRMIDADGNR
jgi:hypothetical protein